MKRITVAFVLFALFSSFAAAGDSFKAGDLFYDLLSPSLASSGASFVNLDSPLAAMNNPAAAGFLQRPVLEAANTFVSGSGEHSGWGNIAALGFAYPGKAGVLSASLFLLNSNFNFYNEAFLAGINVSGAKDIYENLSIGIGLNFGYGNTGGSDWMLSADLGFIYFPHEFLNHKNFRWGAVLKNLGKGFSPDGNSGALPALFSPGVGAGINIFETSRVAGDLTADIFFPSFQNVVVDFGTYITFANSLRLNFAARANYNILSDTGARVSSFSPTIGVSYGFRRDLGNLNIETLRERDLEKTDIIADAAVTQIARNIRGYGIGARILFGLEDNEGPVITITYPEIQHISPGNFGANHELLFPIRIEDRRFVMGYTFDIMDEAGNIVRTYENKENRPENINFRNILDRILYVRSGIYVPETFSWDGLCNNRLPVPDGTYFFSVTAWDDSGNVSTSARYTVIVDTVPPLLILEQPATLADMIFSPDGDGYKDFFTIRQSGSVEKFWLAEIYDKDGNVVRTFDFSGQAPVDIVWDGRGDDGLLLPDGVYSYRITGEDFARNRTTGYIRNIVISTVETPVELRISDSAFSPGNAEARSTLTFFMDVPVKEGIESWVLDIISERDNRVSATISGQSVIPEQYVFDGRAVGFGGNFLADGRYRARLRIIYIHGNRPEAFSPAFIVDTVPPSATVTAQHTVFSPQSGNRDFLVLQIRASQEDLWEGTIYDKNNNPLRVFQWRQGVPATFSWNGTGADGRILPDGDYYFVLSATDAAGNRGSSPRLGFTIDTRDTPIALTRNYDAFSPNNDGVQDIITFFPRTERGHGVERYLFTILNERNEPVFRQEGTGGVPETIIWDGRIALGAMAGRIIEGRYSARLEVLFLNGNHPTATAEPFLLDITPPSIEIEIDHAIFSPGSGYRDFVTIRMINPSYEDEWRITIRDANNNVVRSTVQRGRPENFAWDGRDNTGNIVRNGIYRFTIESQDAAGNRTARSINSIEVDTRITQAIVLIEQLGFSPNTGNNMDTMEFLLVHTREVPVESWSLRVISSAGSAVRTFTAATAPPASIRWDGRNERGEIIDGTYRAEFTVTYKKGDIKTSQTRNFILDTTPPRVEIILTPFPFSPDNDGIDDELYIMIRLEDRSPIRSWEMQIKDPYRRNFKRFAGTGLPPQRIVWDGMSAGGELVQSAEDYPYTFTATDIFGNSTTVTGLIAVDILVMRDGDNLRIKISSINFAPYSSSLVTDDPEINVRNERIIQRLSEILNRFSAYRIVIEGHANNLSWQDPVRAAREEREELIPLSKARSEAVKNALVQRGVAADRMTTIGAGGTRPVVPFGDLENRWKNRRVEFLLIR